MKIVILGAGKIARGFIAHLLYLSGHDFIFIEKAKALVDLLNERKSYRVNVLGNPEKSIKIQNVSAVSLDDAERAISEISAADVIFTAVGGKNLAHVVPTLQAGILKRSKENHSHLNIITCENWSKPAKLLDDGIRQISAESLQEYMDEYVGITESVVMRSAIEPTMEALEKDPLVVNVQDYWELPIDKSRLKSEIPSITGVKLLDNFQGFLDRKFYTYNAANGTVSYLGYLKGYKYISDAAHDEEILKNLNGVYGETGEALSRKHGYILSDQLEFAKTSLRKLQDTTIVDYIERNARDPIRKLGPKDRLVGPANLVVEYGLEPKYLAESIAAAIYYDHPDDMIALQLKDIRLKEGIGHILENICNIDKNSILGRLVKEKIKELKARGWIKE